MTNTKSTKRSLLASVMALFLCFTMLLGTTFAWFTDSVTSANNIIKAGNLDIELYHSDKAVTDEKVGENTKLFDEVALWEPGVMVWEELTVKNEGDLTLKYQLTLNVLEATEIDGVSFSSMLKVALVDDEFEYTRENVEAIAADEWQDLATFTLADKLDKTENDVYGIVIWWQPSENDNLFNMNNGNKGKEVSVKVGVTLFATQLEAESDSFDNTYDKDAWVDGFKVYSAEDLQTAINNGETEITLMADMQLEEPIEIPAPAVATYSARNAVVIDLNGKTITAAYNESTDKHAYAIDNYGNLILNGGTIEARGIYNQEGATITVNGTKIVNLDMNGGSCIWGYGGAIYLNDATLIGYTGCVYSKGYLEINGGTYTCYSAVTNDGEQISPTYNIRSYGDLVINDGDFTSRHGLLAIAGDAEINGGTYTMTSIGVITSHVFYVFADSSNVVVNGGTFNCDLRTAQNNGSSMICVDAANTTINVYGGTFNLTPAKYVVDGYKAVANADGSYSVIFPQESFDSLIENAAENATIEIPAGTYNFPGSKLEAGQTLNCAPGTVFEGAKLNANGATIVGATFQNTPSSNTVNGYYKNCTFTGSNGLRYGYAGDTVVFENCVFSGSTYGVHFDGGAKEVKFIGCTFSGFNAMAASITLATYENCTFVANGKSNYNGINMWGNTEMTNCTFVFDGTADYEWIDLCSADKYATFTGCVVTDGKNEYGVEEFISKRHDSGVLTVDGNQIVHDADALKYAIENATDGTVIALGADIKATDVVTMAEISGKSVTLNLNGHNIDASLNGSEGWSQIFRVSKGATFTVVGDGEVHATAYPTQTYGSVIFNNVGGDLIISGGKYTMTYGTYTEGYLLPAIVDTNSNTEKATTTINGGEFYHNRNMFRNFAQPQRGEKNATLIINGGTFVGEADDYATIWNQKTSATGVEGDGIVIITGGNFTYMDICNDFESGVNIADGLNIAVN